MNKFRWGRLASVAVFALGIATSCASSAPADTDWLLHGNDTAETRFSPLEQIQPSNIERLRLAWSLDLPDENALEATPLEVGGKLYFPGGFGRVYAVDAVSGKQVWMFDAKDVQTNPLAAARIYGVNRGVAYHDGKIFYASRDGRMIALNAATGKVVWLKHFLAPKDNAASTGAPRIFGDKLIIGSSGAEEGSRGFVTAMDTRTGATLWKFNIIPGNPALGFEDEAMERAAPTWSGEWWKYGGGGNAWNGITYDPEFGQILIGTGNGGPWNCHERSNAPGKTNLYLASIVALDAKTGKYKWHYQYNPRECWDWKATSDMILTDMTVDGASRKVVMQAPSNGFFYVIDRSNGKLLAADKWAKANWADRIDLKTGLPVEKPGIRYDNGGPVDIWPSTYGAHSWQAMAYNPKTKLVYIPSMQMGFRWTSDEEDKQLLDLDLDKPRLRTGVKLSLTTDGDPRDNHGALVAWDPVAHKEVWRADYPVFFNGGAMTTSGGLVFHGTVDGNFYAYDATSGRQVWKFDAHLGIFSAPITYSVRGRQYVSILVGPGGGSGEIIPPGQNYGWKYGVHPRRLLTFALDGKAKLPMTPPPDRSVTPLDDPAMVIDPVRVRRGLNFYQAACTFCHGGDVAANGNAPDLRESGIAFDRTSLREVVKGGALMARGMPRIELSDEQLEDVYHYVRSAARLEKQRQDNVAAGKKPS